MKILYLTPFYYPDHGYTENYLPAKLKELGHKVEIITSCLDRYSKKKFESGIFVDKDVKVHRLKFRKIYENKIYLKNLKKLICHIKPDIVLSTGGIFDFNIYLISALKKKLGFKLFCESHMHYSVINDNIVDKLGRLLFKNFFLPRIKKMVDRFIVYSKETKELLKKIYNININKMTNIHIGISVDNFYPDKFIRDEIRKDLKLTEEDVVIVYAGKLNEDKKPFTLLKAFNTIKNKKNLKLIFIGDGETNYLLKMKKYVSFHKLNDNVIFIDRVNNQDLYKYYNASDIGVWPSQESLTMLEAAACGLPIIAKNSDYTRERMAYHNGFTYQENDLVDLRIKMDMLINDKNLRKKMGNEGIKLVRDKYDWKIITKQYIKLLEKTS
jgi:glycosyltransferase involved in cell wall biosynthesis